ncbi:FHA domain-containing protein [Streptomyces sp. NPDC048521]|uniref:FHA domain-containing protein n=1 Tax=Streptomyces sp. NPDC048521 TaxID=3365566 RepID=UPI003712AC61
MQIRLTVVDPLGPSPQRGRAASRDVLVTAPTGTDLAAVASALAGAVTGEGGTGRDAGGSAVVLYAGTDRLDPRRCVLGEPPLVDGAVLSLGGPAAPEPHPELDDAPTQLHVVAGPDAGGVHLLHGGRITVGRSAEADVPLDDPDVSRLHCAVTVGADGRVSVADLNSTNGTALDGTRVSERPVRFPAGALLRIGESALRVTPSGGPGARVRAVADGEGCVRVALSGGDAGVDPGAGAPGSVFPPAPSVRESSTGAGGPGGAEVPSARAGGAGGGRSTSAGAASGAAAGGPAVPGAGSGAAGHARVVPGSAVGAAGSAGSAHHAYDAAGWDASGGGTDAQEHRPGEPPVVPGQPAAPSIENRGGGRGASGTASETWSGGPGGAGAAPEGWSGGPQGTRTGSGRWSGASGTTGAAPENRGGGPEATGPTSESWSGGRGVGGTASQNLSGGPRGSSAAPEGRNEGPQETTRMASGRWSGGSAAGGAVSEDRGGGRAGSGAGSGGETHAGRFGVGGAAGMSADPDAGGAARGQVDGGTYRGEDARAGGRKGTPLSGTDAPQGARRRGLGAWARRLAGGRAEQPAGRGTYDGTAAHAAEVPAPGSPQQPETWPDPAALLLTALGPGPRLWERGTGHPEMLTVRLGTADRSAPDGSGLLPAVPVTAALREVGALGLAGPRPRLSGLARAVLAQLAALHSPDLLEIVLISADRARPVEERTAEWSWLGWLPHVRPGHGQDCRLLLAYDREQAAARTEELLRRVEDHAATGRSAAHPAPSRVPAPPTATAGPGHTAPPATPDRTAPGHTARPGTPGAPDRTAALPGTPGGAAQGPLPGAPGAAAPGTSAGAPGAVERGYRPRTAGDPDSGTRASASRSAGSLTGPAGSAVRGADAHGAAVPAPHRAAGSDRRPSWAREDAGVGAGGGFSGPYTVVVVDGDPGGAALREAVARLAVAGPRAGIHVVCLAETEPASPAFPVAQTYEAACAVTPTFRHCGAVALLSGDVATALHLMRVAPGGPVGPGTVAAVDAVSAAWAERFARALAPLRPDGPVGERHARVATPLPRSARLLDELGLARATPASLMARWADAADDTDSLGGRARAVLGAGPRGPVSADLVADGPHLLIEGPVGSGRTELLRAVVASLAAAERPDRLGVVLIDGRDGVGTGGRDEGLRVCTDIPHVTTHLAANDPVRMREFAQSLSAELKRRAELLGRTDFAEWHRGREVSGRIVAQRTPAGGDIDTPPSSTLRLRPGMAARQRAEAAPPLPRLVVVVDDLDALVSPPLGSPGRPAAGSVMRALEAVAREGERLGVHLVAAAGADGRTAETEPARRAGLRVTLDVPEPGPDEPAPGRGRLACADGRVTEFQGGRVTGRIPRTATQRPTVVPLEWQRMGDPPARRPVRELGNGPTDLALLASAVERAARQVSAAEVPSLL